MATENIMMDAVKRGGDETGTSRKNQTTLYGCFPE